MFFSESLELLNRNYASSTDSDYEVPDYVQKKSLHETGELTGSTPNQLEKEEKMRRIFETKINRYPLRHYVNLGTGFDIQSRPNYYESDQEEEEEDQVHQPIRRRHSIAALLGQEEEEENGEVDNLCGIIRKRRYSEGSVGSLVSDENFSGLQSDGKSADIQDSVCITRTVTYRSKKQIIKFYQTENLILDHSQSETVRERLSGNNSKSDKQQEFTDIVDKICRGTIPTNASLKEHKEVRGRRKLLDCQTDTPKQSPIVQNEKRTIQNETEIKHMDLQRWNMDPTKCTVKDKKNKKSNFLRQLGLQTQSNSKRKICRKKAENIALTCTKEISDKQNELAQTNGENFASSLEKDHEQGKAFGKARGKRKVSQKSPLTPNIALDLDTKPGENTRVRVDNKTDEKKALDKPNVKINLKLKNDLKIDNSNKKLGKQVKGKYLEIVKDCENLFQPDLLLRKDSLLVKRTDTESLEKTVTNESRDNTKQTTYKSEICEENIKTKEKPRKKKVTWYKETGKINYTENVMPKGTRKIYNIEELECKVRSLFKEPLNKSLLEKKKNEKTVGCDLNTKDKKKVDCEKTTDPHPNNEKEKPPRYCILHKKKANSKKRVKRELERIKQRKICCGKEKLHLPKIEIVKIKKKIAVLREKRHMLCKIKSALEKTLCTKVCSKHSCLKLRRYRRKTNVEGGSVAGPSKPNEDEAEHLLVIQSNAELQTFEQREISESNSMTGKESVDDTEQAKLNEEATTEEKPEDLHVGSEKKAYDSIEVVHDCCCCSPRTRMGESSYDFPTANNDLSSEHLRSEQAPKMPEESEMLDVISLCESSMDGMDSENLTAYIDSCGCAPPPGTERNSTDQELESKEIISIDITDDVAEENSTSILDMNIYNTTKEDECDRISRSQISREESQDQDLQNLIIALTHDTDTSPSSPEASQTDNDCITKGSTATVTTDNVQLSMTGMEHYKKRLIHQHEKPGTASSPCTTTEEEDDSLESPLSPASSVQSRDSGSREKRKEDAVQKVARKRAVCRSQFRHQNMELFKLGSSIPTSLCKTKEPYNICTEKNLQLCYQNGKKCDKNSAKGSLTESILNTMDGGKKKDVPLWRSISLTNDTENKNVNSNSGRHILPAIVPELPEHRRSRIKSVPENTSKTVMDNAKAQRNKNGPGNAYYFVEENEETITHKNHHAADKETTIWQKSSVEVEDMSTVHKNKNITTSRLSTSSAQMPDTIKAQSIDASTTRRQSSPTATNTKTQPQNVTEVPYIRRESSSTERHEVAEVYGRNITLATETQGIVPAHSQNIVRRSISSESDTNDCVPINLSLKAKEDVNGRHSWPDLVNTKRNGVNNNQHLTNAIPRQPSNIPKKPQQDVGKKTLDENIASAIASEGAHVDKDGNCFFVTSIPGTALDPQKQSNVIVINFPHIQQQMARMEKSPSVETSLDMLDSAIMSLVNIVKSSVESVFNVMSLPVLNRLYIDLNRYLVLPAVSVKMKMCIEEALNSLIIYLLANLLRTPCTSKARDFVHKMLLLDLRPHMDFLINSLGVIQQKIKYDHFMDELLNLLSHSPHFRAPREHFSMQQVPLDYRDYRGNNLWMENSRFQFRNEAVPPYELMPGIPPQKRGRRLAQEGQNAVPMDTRIPENFSAPNLTLMRPDSYLADNRCIPPNNHPGHPEQFYMQSASQPRPKGRPRNMSKINKTAASKHGEPLAVLPVNEQILNRRLSTEHTTAVTNRNHDPRGSSVDDVSSESTHRSSETMLHREATEEVTHDNNSSRLAGQKCPSEGALVVSKTIENTGNKFDYNVRRETNRKQQNAEMGPSPNMLIPAPPSDTTMDLSINKAHRGGVRSVKNVEAPLKPDSVGKALIIGNAIMQRKEQNEDSNPRKLVPVNGQTRPTSGHENVVKQFPVPDVDRYLQKNIILNKSQTPAMIRSSILEDEVSARNSVNKTSVIVNDEKEITGKLGNTRTIVKSDQDNADSETVGNSENREAASRSKHEMSEQSKNDSISSTVIIKDKSMVVSKGGVSSLQNRAPSNPMDLDDVVLERVSPNVNSKGGISCTPVQFEGPKANKAPSKMSNEEADITTEGNDVPPKLIKLTSLKRRLTQDERWQKKPNLGAFNSDEVVVIEDDEQSEEFEKLDWNQNDVTTSIKTREDGSIASQQSEKPEIEDISSEEETLEAFRLYSTYENKLPGDPRKILQTTEVSHCTLIPGNVKAVQNANWHLFERTPVYTRPVLPRKHRRLSLDLDTAPRRVPLANLVHFEEDRDSFTYSLNLNNSEHKYPSSMDVRGFSPPESRNQTSRFKSPLRPIPISPARVQTSPVIPKLPVVQTSPVAVPNLSFVPGSPGAHTPPPVVQTSPVPVPTSPFVMGPPIVPTSPRVAGRPVVQTSPVSIPHLPLVPAVQISPLNESEVNWGHWFAEEQRKGLFNFERARRASTETLGSDYGSNFSPEEPYCEIKIDSKMCRIKKSLLERIPKGKLCYVRESNTFVRYFDNSQMELFISNLNLGEGSTAAKDLLKQVRGRADASADIETPSEQCEPSQKGEVITLAKDVAFSTEDFLSDPELYVEEVEKVQRYVPKDFYGFYKFVTGYQIVNHHPPISFQTFLTMHNTNGIRGLLKNYVNTLVEGRNIL